MDQYASWKIARVKGKYLPWISCKFIRFFRQRDNAWSTFCQATKLLIGTYPGSWQTWARLKVMMQNQTNLKNVSPLALIALSNSGRKSNTLLIHQKSAIHKIILATTTQYAILPTAQTFSQHLSSAWHIATVFGCCYFCFRQNLLTDLNVKKSSWLKRMNNIRFSYSVSSRELLNSQEMCMYLI